MENYPFIFLTLLSWVPLTTEQSFGFGCPTGWVLHESQCYRFYFDEPRVYKEAATACWVQGSALLSVNSNAEHMYITQFLNRHGTQSSGIWYTSGVYMGGVVKWNGDGTYTNNTANMYWNSPEDQALQYTHIVYKRSALHQTYGWSMVSTSTPLYYVCEIPRTEMTRIIQQKRDFGFGTNETMPAKFQRGPEFIVQPNNTVVVESQHVTLDCVATGNPQPEFKWFESTTAIIDQRFHHSTSYQEITSTKDSRYTFTNGKLTIQSPRESVDTGTYQCRAENKYGSILSEPLSLSFGYLFDFSPNPPGAVVALINQGTYIKCNPPSAKPALNFQWYKDADTNLTTRTNVYTKTYIASNFIRPALNTYTFISYNGNLYFSEVQYSDVGMYFCVVTLSAPIGGKLSTTQPPSRSSKGIELRVDGSPSSDYGPIIHNDFIAVFPKPAMVGYDVTMECFAFGKMPLQYSWSRKDKPFPKGTTFRYDNRVMTIPKAKFEDGGTYTCQVVKLTGKQNIVSKSIVLVLEAKPYFTFPLRDMHADVGSSLTWRCEAQAMPRATFSWYRNSQLLTHTPGQVEIHENVLFIKSLDQTRDQGMYQCAASNAHGTSITSAQLRVLSIKPSFYKNPLSPQTVAASGGNMTIKCQPEAAPTPTIEWTKNGQAIGNDDKHTVLLDGTLHVSQMTPSDQGQYTCKATNINGEGQSSTRVSVFGGVRFSQAPVNTFGQLNRTSFLYCEATYDYGRYDLVYVWKFNGHMIDGEHDPFYRTDFQQGLHGLYIVNAQYYHSGVYECVAQTVFTSISTTATVTVIGPPGEPAGVYVESESIKGKSLKLMWTWTSSMNHGALVNFFVIEAHTQYDPTWQVLAEDIPAPFTVVPGFDEKRFFVVDDLLPNNGYTFRVLAKNERGVGVPSSPKGNTIIIEAVHGVSTRKTSKQTGVYRIPAAAPTRAPTNVGGGGGSVGTLTMTWQPLSRSEEGGKGFGYKVYWRLANQTRTQWNEKLVGNKTSYVHTVGIDNYYLLYEVKVQAYNNFDGSGRQHFGPQSDIAYVYSAEGMPLQRPKNVKYQNINGTALLITWDQVPSTREAVKGRVLGYEVEWIEKGGRGWVYAYLYVYCECGQATVIGLQPNSDYWFHVEVFNTAGKGTPSEKYLASTYEWPPRRYPLFVTLYSHGLHSALVKWRGVNIIQGEATLSGYKLMWWPVGDDIRTANQTTVPKVTEAVIYGLQFDVIYKLRVMAMNRGGDGKKSPTVYFTMLRDGSININQASFDPTTSQFMLAAAPRHFVQNFVLLCTVLLYHALFR